jgi:hypothetical protein
MIDAIVRNNSEYVLPWLTAVIEECNGHIERERGTWDRLVVRVGIANRGIQDGLVASEAALLAPERTFRLPPKVNRRPWDIASEDYGPVDASHVRLPARSFMVLDFIVDEKLNAPADVARLVGELKRGCKAKVTTHGLGRRVLASLVFSAELPRI